MGFIDIIRYIREWVKAKVSLAKERKNKRRIKSIKRKRRNNKGYQNLDLFRSQRKKKNVVKKRKRKKKIKIVRNLNSCLRAEREVEKILRKYFLRKKKRRKKKNKRKKKMRRKR